MLGAPEKVAYNFKTLKILKKILIQGMKRLFSIKKQNMCAIFWDSLQAPFSVNECTEFIVKQLDYW